MNLKHRRIITLLICLAIGITALSQANLSNPNIILLMGDDHGWEETGYNGHPFVKTPVLDEMAKNGLQFNRFYSSAPTCSPTRASILTGRNHNRCGTFEPGWSFRPEEITIAEILKDKGYTTGHFGKWHVGPVDRHSPVSPVNKGFDYSVGHDNFFDLNPTFSVNGEVPTVFKGESSEILVNEAAKFMDNAKRQGKPFFIMIWFGSPHEPYQALDADLALYENLPDTFANREVTLTSIETGLQVQRQQRAILKVRYAEITAMDRAIGKLRNHLSDTGLKNNTLLWYCGDNGTSSDAAATIPFRERKGSIYDGGLRVPGIIEWPARIEQHRVCDMNVVATDILPTLCAITQAELPARIMDGIDISGVFDGTMSHRPRPIMFWNATALTRQKNTAPYIESNLQKGTTPTTKRNARGEYTRNFLNFSYHRIDTSDYEGPRAIIDNRYKLVVDGENGRKSVELFDLETDPAEKYNIISTRPDLARKMKEELNSWQTSVLHSLTGNEYK